jgi:hypothetical protein
MAKKSRPCPECATNWEPTRRDFLRAAGAAAAVLAGGSVAGRAAEAGPAPETTVKRFYDSLSPEQRKVVCFDWDYVDPKRGLLRTRVAANWQITPPEVKGEFFTPEQQRLIREIFEGIVQPDWHARFDKQLQDDAGGFGRHQSVAVFGRPGEGKFEFVLTGRHMTLRCDGNSADHVAFGGPIFYGHAASGFTEKPGHPGNVFWPQAQAANELFPMLDGTQQAQALVAQAPEESRVGFRGVAGEFPGIRVGSLSADQRELVRKVLLKLLEPYRQTDREEVLACLKAQGGLDRCGLAFYQQEDLGSDRVWDIWRLEGPAFVWHFRGAPHVHVWVHVADDPTVRLNA